MRIFRSIALFLLCCLPFSPSHAQDESGSVTLDYVLARYIENMGGRASLQKIKSVRLRGEIAYPDGTSHAITVLKKKPNLVRIILDTGTLRIIQAYDGEVAWFAREMGRNQFVDRMRGAIEATFVRDAPLESVLVNAYGAGVVLELGDDIEVARIPCYQIIANFPDGSRTIHCIDKEEYNERRIYQFDENGKLLAELIPSKFELFDGVLFSMQTVRVNDGEVVSTLTVTDVEINMGILDTAFSPPTELPPL